MNEILASVQNALDYGTFTIHSSSKTATTHSPHKEHSDVTVVACSIATNIFTAEGGFTAAATTALRMFGLLAERLEGLTRIYTLNTHLRGALTCYVQDARAQVACENELLFLCEDPDSGKGTLSGNHKNTQNPPGEDRLTE